MFVVHLLLYVFYWLIVHTKAESACVTPHGEAGTCVVITSCPRLLDAFANPVHGSEEYLFKFKCSNALEYTSYYNQDTFVCCGVSPNFIVVDNSTLNDVRGLSTLSDTEYCGMQHKDDFPTTDDDGIAIHEFPWVASILGRLLDQENASLCSGTLINSRYVLTSAYCVLSVSSWLYRPLFVRLGEFDKKNTTDCVDVRLYNTEECSMHEDFGVDRVTPHPFYNPNSGINNILLLRLKTRVQYSDYIRPICLPIPGIALANQNDVLDISAVGSEWDYVGINTLKIKTNATLITNEKCGEALSKYHKIAHPHLICTTNLYNETSAAEYEGAPLMFHRKIQWHIEGVMVDRHFCSIASTCVFTRVSRYLRWIQDKIHV